MRLIDADRLAVDYCMKMCAGGCSGVEKEKCEFLNLLNEQPEEGAKDDTIYVRD